MADPSTVNQAREAVERGDWAHALELLAGWESGEGDPPPPAGAQAEAFELRAAASYGAGDLEGSVAAWERLHAHHVATGDLDEAARAAAMIGMYLMMDTGLMAPVRGWLQRAETLLANRDTADTAAGGAAEDTAAGGAAEDTAADALIAMTRTYERFMCGDLDGARAQSERAIELGQRLGVQPAAVIGRVARARVRIFDGEMAEGLADLDEIGTLLMSGSVDPLTTGMMYCELVCAAQGLALHDRARQWTDVMEHWRHGAAFGGINGRCRVHRAEMLRISGPCDEAEAEALGACDELRPWMRREFGWPLTELGNVRLRKGDLEGAEEAYLAAHEHAWNPHPGLALVRLAQGEVAAAQALITEAIAHPSRIPSKERPPFDDLPLAPLFEAQAEIAAAAGDVETARQAATSLENIARRYPSPGLAAASALAAARAALLDGDADGAKAQAQQAVGAWAEMGAPFETAVARLVLAEAHRSSGNVEAARLELGSAQRAFAAFGAARLADETEARLAGAAGPAHRPSPTPKASTDVDETRVATFARDGEIRVAGLGSETVQVRDLKGFRYVERLLADPGREYHVLDLVAVEQGTLPTGTATMVGSDDLGGEAGGGLPALDDQAREAYRRRLAEVEADIEEAEANNDPGRAELAQRDRDYLVAELTRAVGLAGRHRSIGSDAERARTSVTRSIRYAIGKLAEHHPSLATHLTDRIRTGTYCSYGPDPVAALDWRFGDPPTG